MLPFGNSEFSDVGGKGYNLGKMITAGFNIPDGFIVTTHAYRKFVENNNLKEFIKETLEELDITSISSLEDRSKLIRDKFESYSLPDEISNKIDEFYKSNHSKIYAVRSSATAEDLPTLSFAGQHDTFLNVKTIDQLKNAVVKCFSSLWTARAIQYREKNKVDHLEVNNAVVVQEMIQSEVSGVIFTANPITGNRDETVIEAIFGLGEALVSGLVEPDTYVISKGRIIDRKTGNQQKSIISISDGGVQEIEEERANSEVLTDKQLLELDKVARQIFEYYNSPQDIEFAIKDDTVYILQSRSITTLYPQIKVDYEDLRIYISFNMAQGVLKPFTKLGSDILSRFLFGVGKTYNFGGEYNEVKAFQVAGDRLWVDITSSLNNKMAKKAVLGFMWVAEPESAKIIMENIHRFPKTHGLPRIKPLQQVFHDLIFFGRLVKRIFKNPDKARNNAFKRSEQFLAQLERQRTGLDTIDKKLDYIETSTVIIPKFLFIDLAPFISTTMISLSIAKKMGKPEESGLSYLDLARSYPYNVTSEMNHYLWGCSQRIKKDIPSFAIFDKKNTEIIELFKNNRLLTVLQEELDGFMKKYGFRGYSEIDVGAERWSDDPEPIINHIKGYLKIENEDEYPDNLFKLRRKEAEDTYKILLDKINKKNRLKAKIFNHIIKVNRKVSGMREYPKFIWIKSLNIIKKEILEIGKLLVENGDLDNDSDVFYLNLNDIRRGIDLKDIARNNKDSYDREYNRELIPRILLSNGETFFNAKPNIELKEGMYIGTPVSPGIVEAKARVVLSPDEGTLLPGEILVCPATDPSWTPLFNIASGLVMEVGGLMTHGSVVAREHGIVGIVGVPECTRLIKTGDKLKINGSTGIIELID